MTHTKEASITTARLSNDQIQNVKKIFDYSELPQGCGEVLVDISDDETTQEQFAAAIGQDVDAIGHGCHILYVEEDGCDTFGSASLNVVSVTVEQIQTIHKTFECTPMPSNYKELFMELADDEDLISSMVSILGVADSEVTPSYYIFHVE